MKPNYSPKLESIDDDDDDNDATVEAIVHRELPVPSEDSSDSKDDVHVPGLFDSMEVEANETQSPPHHATMSQHSQPYMPMTPRPFPFTLPGYYSAPNLHGYSRGLYMAHNIQGDFKKSYPVFDMRHVHRISVPTFQNIKVNPMSSTEDLKLSISRQFNTQMHNIHIIDEAGKKEGTLMKTIIIILPEGSVEACYTLLFECFGSPEQTYPQILCARLPVDLKVEDAGKLVADVLRWKSLALCSDKCVLDTEDRLNECSLKDFVYIQAVNHCLRKVKFCHQPKSDVFSYFLKGVNTCKSVKHIKDEIEKHFGDELAKHKHHTDDDLHFCFKGKLLNGKQCIGLILSENAHDEGIFLYFAPKESIIITLQYKMGKLQKQQFMIVAKQTSTADLRFEASKHMNVDPLAVKLTLEKKFIDEHDNLLQFYAEKWKNGIVLVAGIKKRKTIRIKHPITGDEKAFEMYMLQPVSMLKRKVAAEWNLTYLETTLYLRDIMMKNWQPLQFYPIKNNMEITLQLYPRRIAVKLVILQLKLRVKLIVNDISDFTVDELLRYCAHKFEYAREFSRGIYKDRCLDRNLTLEQEGIHNGDTIVIAYFDQPNKLQGCLINVFMVRSDGHTVKRIGAVNSSILLHAPKSVSSMTVEYDTQVLDNGPIPSGVYICDGPCGSTTKLCNSKTKNVPGKSRSVQLLERCMSRKPELLRRARSLIETREYRLPSQLVKQSSSPVFYLPDQDDSPEPKTSSSDGEFSVNEETDKKVPMKSQSNSDSDKTEPDFDCKRSTPDQEMVMPSAASNNGQDTLYQTPDFSSLLDDERLENETELKIDKNESTKPKEVFEEFAVEMRETELHEHDTSDRNVVNVNNEGIDPDKDVDDTSRSRNNNADDASHSVPKEFVNTLSRNTGSEFSSLDGSYTNIHDNVNDSRDMCHNGDGGSKDDKRMKLMPYVRHRPRVHTLSEGSDQVNALVPVDNHKAELIHVNTCPFIHFVGQHCHLHSSGITTKILRQVGSNLGKKWRMLLRSLDMEESYLDDLEYQHGNKGLDELGVQALIAWKQYKGKAASVDVLVTALEGVGLKSVAEQYCTSGFNTM
ncbi:hypothetical protein ACF0H5_010965 [Mactra antiquata]